MTQNRRCCGCVVCSESGNHVRGCGFKTEAQSSKVRCSGCCEVTTASEREVAPRSRRRVQVQQCCCWETNARWRRHQCNSCSVQTDWQRQRLVRVGFPVARLRNFVLSTLRPLLEAKRVMILCKRPRSTGEGVVDVNTRQWRKETIVCGCTAKQFRLRGREGKGEPAD